MEVGKKNKKKKKKKKSLEAGENDEIHNLYYPQNIIRMKV
jgi:hypothetical protein